MTFYYVYILRSQKDGRLYIGYTGDLKARLEKHNSGGNKSTSNRRPLNLIHHEAFSSEQDARTRERFLKTGHGREEIKILLQNTLKQSDTAGMV